MYTINHIYILFTFNCIYYGIYLQGGGVSSGQIRFGHGVTATVEQFEQHFSSGG